MKVVNPQSIASIARQILAIAGIVMAVVTSSVSGLHLPVAVSSILGIGGAVILAIEHYVADPSTGSTTAPSPVTIHTPGPVTATSGPAA